MSALGPAASGHASHHAVLEALRSGDYERASLRLLYGLLTALDEMAAPAREELLHLMVERCLPAHRDPHTDGGHR